mmetsp:Transcript_30002/g.75675  ORF Transcript_30002/g.75675 Transcript_30002/m.75675 type:complete len:286 (+) Transcript_30002:87-944(+)
MPSTFAQVIVALSAAFATGVKVEIYYGPYCPNSANYLSMYVQPFLYANIPGVTVTMLPFIQNDLQTQQFPANCPSNMPGNPCTVLPAPMCALQPFLAAMPAALTPKYKAAINFAICDLIHANHGAPATLTHTQADIQKCATDSQADWISISGCMANPVADEAFKARVVAANAQVNAHPGKIAPFVFVDGEMIDNTQALLTAVCAKLPGDAQCAAALATSAYEVGVPVSRFHGAPRWVAWTGAVSMIAGVAFVASRVLTWHADSNLRDHESRSLARRLDEPESPKE